MNTGAEGSAVPWITLVAAVIAAVVGIIGALLQRKTGRETSLAAARCLASAGAERISCPGGGARCP